LNNSLGLKLKGRLRSLATNNRFWWTKTTANCKINCVQPMEISNLILVTTAHSLSNHTKPSKHWNVRWVMSDVCASNLTSPLLVVCLTMAHLVTSNNLLKKSSAWDRAHTS